MRFEIKGIALLTKENNNNKIYMKNIINNDWV